MEIKSEHIYEESSKQPHSVNVQHMVIIGLFPLTQKLFSYDVGLFLYDASDSKIFQVKWLISYKISISPVTHLIVYFGELSNKPSDVWSCTQVVIFVCVSWPNLIEIELGHTVFRSVLCLKIQQILGRFTRVLGQDFDESPKWTCLDSLLFC